ncbi:hypothetical protein ACFLYH_00950 [Candidatus Dependentiae bacterium]
MNKNILFFTLTTSLLVNISYTMIKKKTMYDIYYKHRNYVYTLNKIMKNPDLQDKIFNLIINKTDNLNLSNCNITTKDLKFIIDMLCILKINKQLRILCLKNNDLKKIPKNIQKLKNLENLNFKKNPYLEKYQISLSNSEEIKKWFSEIFNSESRLQKKIKIFLNSINKNNHALITNKQ